MDKTGNRRKYVSANANSLIAKYRNAGDNETDNCRKCRQANDLSHERNERRQSNPIDSTTNYYSTEYKPRKHHVSSASRTKYLVPTVPEESYRTDNKNYKNLRTLRNQLYVNNVAIVRKNNYKDDEYEEEEERKYVEEENELTGDDAEEETLADVADENCENASEYDQHEADDEVDDESDAFERPVDRIRTQKKTRIENVSRCRQRNEPVEPSQHHRGHKIIQSKPPARCCHPVADRDPIDIPTEEEDDDPKNRELVPFPPRKSSWRQPVSIRDRETWNQSRNLIDRYGDLVQTSLASTVSSRRPRTTRPEPEVTSRSAQLETFRNRKSNRCSGSSAHAPKTTSSRNATCRLQDSRYFIKESNGDEGEYFEEAESPTMYQTKSRKSGKESRSPMYESRDESRTLDAEIGAIYKSCRSKNLRESSNGYRECGKHLNRANRQDSSSGTLKNENRYWQ